MKILFSGSLLLYVTVTVLVTLLLRMWLVQSVAQLESENKARRTVINCLDKIHEWCDKYPEVSFRHSQHGRELLAELYAAEKRHSLVNGSKVMDKQIIDLIHTLLENDPDFDPPPFLTGPTVGPVFISPIVI